MHYEVLGYASICEESIGQNGQKDRAIVVRVSSPGLMTRRGVFEVLLHCCNHIGVERRENLDVQSVYLRGESSQLEGSQLRS